MDHSDKKVKKESVILVEFTDVIGGFGKWQLITTFIISFVCFFDTWNSFAVTFFAPHVDHWCSSTIIRTNNSSDWKNWSIPIEIRDGEARYSHCKQYAYLHNGTNHPDIRYVNENESVTVHCYNWDFDKSFYKSTIVEKWNLVCDREWLISLTVSVYMLGNLVSIPVIGHLTDRYGRRRVLLVCISMVFALGLATAFSTSFLMFIIVRFFLSFGNNGAFVISCVLLPEIVSTEYRTVVSMVTHFAWCLAYIIMPGIAWVLRDWFYMQLVITLPALPVLIALWKYVPESPRWLLAHKKLDETVKVLNIAAKQNKKQVKNMNEIVDKIYHYSAKSLDGKPRRHGTVLDLFRTPVLRKRTICIFWTCTVICFVYYGVAFNTNELHGEPHMNFFLSGVVEIPSCILATFLMNCMGRRLSMMATMVVGGISLAVSIFFDKEMTWLQIVFIMAGKFSMTSAYSIMYVYSAEIFPTVVRSVGMCWCVMFGMVGSSTAPFAKEIIHATNEVYIFVIYGGLSVFTGLLVLLLPETSKLTLADSVEQASQSVKKRKSCSSISEINLQNLEKTEIHL